MNAKHVAWWLAGLLAVLVVMAAGVWSLGAATAYAYADDAEAQAAAPAPATFTISGMKYLEGRTLKAGEFSFALEPAGVYAIPAGSPLATQLRAGSSLSAAEKYELVAHGGLKYVSSETQPVAAASTVSNAQDGSVMFSALTFDAASLGQYATQRHAGSVFCYDISEVVPKADNGSLAEGVTESADGQYVYQGITYDSTVKHAYLYVYETGTDSSNTHIEVVPLGDASFNIDSDDPQTGQGDGFLNRYTAAPSDSSQGASGGVTASGATASGAAAGDTTTGGATDGSAASSASGSVSASGSSASSEVSPSKPSGSAATSSSTSTAGSAAGGATASSSSSQSGSTGAASMDPSKVSDAKTNAFQTEITEKPATSPEAAIFESGATSQSFGSEAAEPAAVASVAVGTAVTTSSNTNATMDSPLTLFAHAARAWEMPMLIVALIIPLVTLAIAYAYNRTHEQ